MGGGSMRTRYPYLVTRDHEGSVAWRMPNGRPHSLEGTSSAADHHGSSAEDVTADRGRSGVLATAFALARTREEGVCVVWSPTDCTYALPDGTWRSGSTPPAARLVEDDFDMNDEPLAVDPVWSCALPPDALHEHLCVRRWGDVVAIAPGEPLVVADFIDGPVDPLNDPTISMRDASNRWILPLRHRGVLVTAVRNGAVLLGPVQMIRSEAVLLLDPWVDEIERAANAIAGSSLPQALLHQIWQEVDRRDTVVR